MFTAGDLVEFWSGDRGGVWKPAVVVAGERRPTSNTNIRLEVGPGVYIIRKASKCRSAAMRPKAAV